MRKKWRSFYQLSIWQTQAHEQVERWRRFVLPKPAEYRRPTHWIPYASHTNGLHDPDFVGPIEHREPVPLNFRRHFMCTPGWYVMIDEGRGTPVLITCSEWIWTPVAGPFGFDDLFIDTKGHLAKTTRENGYHI